MEKVKIPITALSMLKNILGIECKGLGNRKIEVNKTLKIRNNEKKQINNK
jgi:hypothetical protein